MPLAKTCPKCGIDVTDKDEREKNIEPAPPQPQGQPGAFKASWQHKKCPTKA